RSAPFIELCINHRAESWFIRVCFQFFHFCNEQNHLEQIIDAFSSNGRNRNKDCIPAPIFRNQFVLCQLLHDSVWIGGIFIHFIDCDNDWHFGRFCMVDCLYSLRHHPIVCSNDQDGDICHFGSSRTHARECFVSR